MPDRRAVVLSATAQRRYAERVRPDLPAGESAAELRERQRSGRMRRRAPRWLRLRRPANAAGFLVLDGEPEAVLPLVYDERSGETVATTVKVRP